MRRGFWSGLLTGGLVGSAMTLFVYPQLKPVTKSAVLKNTLGIRRRLTGTWRSAREGLTRALVRRMFR
ncbi:MAG: hypothetical protein M1299_11075 [Firmicutes bacterium]|nr:hypothetical protein [Bacillota bacterium]MCL5040345.1 hypothetical protein [Bacillota bacterium]